MKGSVPIKVVARVYGKDQSWVRAGIVTGYLPIGIATRNHEVVSDIHKIQSKYGRILYYVSPKLLYEQTGYVWEGEKE